MHFVQPLRTKSDIEKIKGALKERNLRDYALFVLGMNTGLRVSDILRLKVMDVVEPTERDVRIKDNLEIVEKKTGKCKELPLNKAARSALREFLRASPLIYRETSPLFPSRVGQGREPISRYMVWLILKLAANEVGIREKVGTHTMRKTYGYQLYKQGVDITRIQYLLNHSSPEITLSYIGITKDETDSYIKALNL
ncbi:MAG: site-specific integrase [Cloacibacillus sp.]